MPKQLSLNLKRKPGPKANPAKDKSAAPKAVRKLNKRLPPPIVITYNDLHAVVQRVLAAEAFGKEQFIAVHKRIDTFNGDRDRLQHQINTVNTRIDNLAKAVDEGDARGKKYTKDMLTVLLDNAMLPKPKADSSRMVDGWRVTRLDPRVRTPGYAGCVDLTGTPHTGPAKLRVTRDGMEPTADEAYAKAWAKLFGGPAPQQLGGDNPTKEEYDHMLSTTLIELDEAKRALKDKSAECNRLYGAMLDIKGDPASARVIAVEMLKGRK